MAKIGDFLEEKRYTHKLVCSNPDCGEDILLMTEKAAHGNEVFADSNTQWPDGTATKEFEVLHCKSCNKDDTLLVAENIRVIEHFKLEEKS